MRITFLAAFSFSSVFRCFYIDNYNILWYIKIIQLFVHCFGSHTLLSLYLRSVTLPFEIRAIAPSYFNDYAVRSFSRGSFHLYISLPPYYTERVLKASSI